ncbi:MAG: hypothetical protein ACRCWB_04240, partial [Enterovibrio sp.]
MQTHFSYAGACAGISHTFSSVLWGLGSGAKENAPIAPLLFGALFCGYPIHLHFSNSEGFYMLYTTLCTGLRTSC